MLFNLDILVLTLLLSALISLLKVMNIKKVLISIGITFIFFIPLFIGFDYYFLWMREFLYFFMLFLVGILIFKTIEMLKIKYLHYIFILCLILISFFKLKDGLDYSYTVVNSDPILLDENYGIYNVGYKIKTANINEYRFWQINSVHKLYLGGLLRKQLRGITVQVDDHIFEDRLEDGTVILYDNGIYSIKKTTEDVR
jgi:hypothetical protein